MKFVRRALPASGARVGQQSLLLPILLCNVTIYLPMSLSTHGTHFSCKAIITLGYYRSVLCQCDILLALTSVVSLQPYEAVFLRQQG